MDLCHNCDQRPPNETKKNNNRKNTVKNMKSFGQVLDLKDDPEIIAKYEE